MVLNKIILFLILFSITFIIYSCKNKTLEKEKTNLLEENKKVPTEFNNNNSESISTHLKWEPRFDSYANPRFGFSVKYPTNLDKQTESDNGEGKEFKSSDGFKMLVYGSNNVSVLNQSLDELYQKELISHKDVTYKVKKRDWFVVSGYDGENIFYVKKYVGSGSTNTLNLVYPSNLRDKYYDVINVISKSFKKTKSE